MPELLEPVTAGPYFACRAHSCSCFRHLVGAHVIHVGQHLLWTGSMCRFCSSRFRSKLQSSDPAQPIVGPLGTPTALFSPSCNGSIHLSFSRTQLLVDVSYGWSWSCRHLWRPASTSVLGRTTGYSRRIAWPFIRTHRLVPPWIIWLVLLRLFTGLGVLPQVTGRRRGYLPEAT